MPTLNWLTRAEVKDLVTEALKSVGDVAPGMDVESITFDTWTTQHKRVFAVNLVDAMLRRGYDVFLTEDKFDRFADVGELIDYVTEQQAIRAEKLTHAF